MSRLLIVCCLLLLIPVFGAAHQEGSGLRVDKLEVEIGADSQYRGTLTIVVPEGANRPVAGWIMLPFEISDISAVPNTGVSINPIRTSSDSTGQTGQTRLNINVGEPAIHHLTINFTIPFETVPLVDTETLTDLLAGQGPTYYLMRQKLDMGSSGRPRWKLHLRLPYSPYPAPGELIPAQAIIRWGAGVEPQGVTPIDYPSPPSCSDGICVDTTFFESKFLAVSYELPPGDLRKAVQVSLPVVLIFFGALAPFALVAMTALITSFKRRVGAALGCGLAAQMASIIPPVKDMAPTSQPLTLFAGVAAFLLILVLLKLQGVRLAVAVIEPMPDDLARLSRKELQSLLRQKEEHLARLMNEGDVLDGPRASRNANDIAELRDRIRAVEGELARRESPAPDWNMPAIRKLLFDNFSDEDLNTLCADHFHVVYDNFASGMTKGEKILQLLDYCIHDEKIEVLLAAIREARPEQYRRIEERLKE